MAKRKKHRPDTNDNASEALYGRKTDLLTISTAQTVADLASADIFRQQAVVQCELDATEAVVTELEARITDAKAKRRRLLAKLAGFTLALGRRKIEA
jgi:hypothetical protein